MLGRELEARGWSLNERTVSGCNGADGGAPPFPGVDGHDLVIVMGSVHSVYDRSTVGAWIDDELDLIRSAHDAGVPLLGVCFGAQSLAAALGGSVEPSPITEIGWYRISGHELPIDPGPWLQWHHDRAIPPPGAEILATTPETVQLYRIGASVGVQFHPEVDAVHVQGWLDAAPVDYLAANEIDRATFLAEVVRREESSAASCTRLVDWFLGTVDLV